MEKIKESQLVPDSITAYKCSFCGYVSENKELVAKHMQSCNKNPDYVQNCKICPHLDEYYKHSYELERVHICPYTVRFGAGCVYQKHDASEVDTEIEIERGKYLCKKEYGKDISPQERRNNEAKYMEYIKNGISVDNALKKIYGNGIRPKPMRKNYL